MLLSPSLSSCHTPVDRSNSLGDLAARISDAHARVLAATHSALEHAMAAGNMLAEAKDRVGHGRWEGWLKKVCNIPPRTASRYMLLAEHREAIEAKSATVADLTVNAALRLLKPKKPAAARPKAKPKPAEATTLNSLAWSVAPAPTRTQFVSGVGLQQLYSAAPADQRQQFLAWARQQRDEPSPVKPPLPDALQPAAAPDPAQIPEDPAIPPCLRRVPTPAPVPDEPPPVATPAIEDVPTPAHGDENQAVAGQATLDLATARNSILAILNKRLAELRATEAPCIPNEISTPPATTATVIDVPASASPTPTPSPAPSPPSQQPARVRKHAKGKKKTTALPIPAKLTECPFKGWKKITEADELEHRIVQIKMLTDKPLFIHFDEIHWRELDRMTARVSELRGIERAITATFEEARP